MLRREGLCYYDHFNEIDYDFYKEFVEADECICGHCNDPPPFQSPPRNSPVIPRIPPLSLIIPEEDIPNISVVIFDENKGLYREIINNFIVYQITENRIGVYGKLIDDVVCPLAPEDLFVE